MKQVERGAAPFAVTWPGHWLVWETVGFKVSPRSAARTMRLGDLGAAPAQKPDAMCFHLGEAAAQSVQLGRDLDCDVPLNDGTVSRKHLEVIAEGGTWWVRVLEGREATLDGQPVTSQGLPLKPGSRLQVGAVTLTFHDAASLLARLGT